MPLNASAVVQPVFPLISYIYPCHHVTYLHNAHLTASLTDPLTKLVRVKARKAYLDLLSLKETK